MATMAVVSILLTQTDKLAVSKMLPLDMMGFYTLAGSLAVVPLMMAGPIAVAVFPRFTALVEEGDRSSLVRLYHRASRLVALSVIPLAITLAFFAGDFIRAWTGLPATAVETEFTASLLIVGQSMQAVTLIPFYLALAHGDVRLNLKIGVVSIILITPLLIYLIARFGIVGAGLSWVIMNVCTLPPYMYFLHRRFISGEFLTWCIFGVALPILTALPFVLICRLFIPYSESRLMTFIIIGSVWLVSSVFSVMISRELRNEFNKFFNQFLIRLHASRSLENNKYRKNKF
jgi:O-antigen/teichoic acid export membrane protein